MNYIIIGAMDGISFDTIFNKFKKHDKVIFVEPIPFYFELLKYNAKSLYCECYFENNAVSDIREDLELAYLNINKINNYDSFYQGCTSVIKFNEPINIFLKKVNKKDLSIYKTTAITFYDLCKKYTLNKVDYVQVDCEGYDQRIVDSIDLEKYDIQTIKFETHYLDADFIEKFSNKWKNYTYKIDEGDVIFTRL